MNIYMLIDRSSSMGSNWNETISAVNSYMREMATGKGSKKTRATVMFFSGSGMAMSGNAASKPSLNMTIAAENIKVRKWEDINHSDYPCSGMTPLNDGIGKITDMMNDDKPKKAILVVVTDGGENASQELTREQAKERIESVQKKEGWDVIFIGANFDNFSQSAGLGGMRGTTLMATSGNYSATMGMMANKSKAVRSGEVGATMEFNDADRATAVGAETVADATTKQTQGA